MALTRGINLNSPAPPDGFRTQGVSTLYGPDGEVKAQWVKDRASGTPSIEVISEQLADALKAYDGASKLIPSPADIEAYLATVYLIADWHLGLLCWNRETHAGDWDRSIARRVIGGAMSNLIDSSPRSKVAVILGLGDLLHFDGYEPVTRNSRNMLDADGRYPAILETGIDLLIFSIYEALAKHEQIIVRILPGNHDEQSAIAVAIALKMYFSNNKRVTVDTDPAYFWWWSWGDVFLGATHGDQAKMLNLPLLMAQRCPEQWGKSKFRAIYTGHIHTDTAIDKGGVRVRSFHAPMPIDGWHAKMGYGAGRSLTSITWHKTRGQRVETTESIIDD